MKKIYLILILSMLFSNENFSQNYCVGEKTIEYIDSSRNRPIKVEVWYPTIETDSLHLRKTDLPFILEPTIRNAKILNKTFPLIVLSHGTGGNRFSLAWLAIFLVKEGYIVASPDHWGNTFDNKIPEYFVRYWERPLDISFLITQLSTDSFFSQYINKDKIGMVGFSFGGYTSLALAGANLDCQLLKEMAKTKLGKKEFCIPEFGDLRKIIHKVSCDSIPASLKDNRIKAFVALAPALGLGFSNTNQTKDVQAPVLIVSSENDRVAPVETNAENYNKLIPHSFHKTMLGKVGHYIFLNEGNESLKKEAKKYYIDDKTVKRKLIHIKVVKETSDFFSEFLK